MFTFTMSDSTVTAKSSDPVFFAYYSIDPFFNTVKHRTFTSAVSARIWLHTEATEDLMILGLVEVSASVAAQLKSLSTIFPTMFRLKLSQQNQLPLEPIETPALDWQESDSF